MEDAPRPGNNNSESILTESAIGQQARQSSDNEAWRRRAVQSKQHFGRLTRLLNRTSASQTDRVEKEEIKAIHQWHSLAWSQCKELSN